LSLKFTLIELGAPLPAAVAPGLPVVVVEPEQAAAPSAMPIATPTPARRWVRAVVVVVDISLLVDVLLGSVLVARRTIPVALLQVELGRIRR
jgi:hypothetical protein